MKKRRLYKYYWWPRHQRGYWGRLIKRTIKNCFYFELIGYGFSKWLWPLLFILNLTYNLVISGTWIVALGGGIYYATSILMNSLNDFKKLPIMFILFIVAAFGFLLWINMVIRNYSSPGFEVDWTKHRSRRSYRR